MNELPLHLLRSFLGVAEEGSFRGAARRLGISPSAVSHAIRSLEQHLGVALFSRSTRSVRLTREGQAFLEAVGPAVASIRDAFEATSWASGEVRGTLRLTVPRSAARGVLFPYVADMLRRYPEAQVELIDDNGLVDLVAEGFDAGVRFRDFAEEDMVARPFGEPQHFVIVAAPAYLKGRPRPKHPAELKGHRTIGLRFPDGSLYRWEFAKGGEQLSLAPPAVLVVQGVDLALAAALDGIGIAFVQRCQAQRHIDAGDLELLLEPWRPPAERFCLVYPHRRLQRPVLQAFLKVVADLDGAL